jgi:hypothetical protein
MLDTPMANSVTPGRLDHTMPLATDGETPVGVRAYTPASPQRLRESGAFELAHRFIGHLASEEGAPDRWSDCSIDWEAVESAMAGCTSIEHAIGRAVVTLNRMRSTVSVSVPRTSNDAHLPPPANDPFFSFTVSDAAPDFGDGSRFRAKIAKRMAAVLRIRGEDLEPSSPSLVFGTEP